MTAELRKLIEAATKGPWSVASRWGDDWDSVVFPSGNEHDEICQCFHDPDNTEECSANVGLIVYLVNRAEAIACLVEAAERLSDSLSGGFVRCSRCGDQEDTTDLDFAPQLRKALAAWKEIK